MAFADRLDWATRRAANDINAARRSRLISPAGQESCEPDGGAPRLPPRGPDADNSSITRIIARPSVEKLNGSLDFNANDFGLILPAGAGSSVSSANLRFKLPNDNVGWLQTFTLYVLTPNAGTSIQYSIRINQGAVTGFDNLQNPPGIFPALFFGPGDMRVPIGNGGVVDVLITNLNANGPWTVGAQFDGWFHPQVLERRAWNLDL